MSYTPSTLANSPPWSATDSLGYTVWNRLIRPDVSPSTPAIAITGNTSSIHDRHISFFSSITTQPLGPTPVGTHRLVGDARIFRRNFRPMVAGVHELWPIPVSRIAAHDPAPAERPTVMRRGMVQAIDPGSEPLAPEAAVTQAERENLPKTAASAESPMTHSRRSLPVPMAIQDAAIAPTPATIAREPLAPVTPSEARPSVLPALAHDTESGRSLRAPGEVSWSTLLALSRAVPLTVPDTAVGFTPATIARELSAPVTQSDALPSELTALSHETASSRLLSAPAEPYWSTSQPLSPSIAIDQATPPATGVDAVVGNEIGALPPVAPQAPVSRPIPVALLAPMSFQLLSPSAMISPVLTTGVLQRSSVFSKAATPLPIPDARRGPDASNSIMYYTRHRRLALSPALVPQNRAGTHDGAGPFDNEGQNFVSLSELSIDTGVSFASATIPLDVEQQTIQSAMLVEVRSESPDSHPAETGGPELSARPNSAGQSIAKSSSSIAFEVGPAVLAPLDRRGAKSEHWVARRDMRVARAEVAFSGSSLGSRVTAPGIQQTVLGAVIGDGPLPPIIPARATVSPAPQKDPAVRSYVGSVQETIAKSSASIPSQSPSADRSPTAQVDRHPDPLERNLLPVAVQNTPIGRAIVERPPHFLDLPGGLPKPSAPRTAHPEFQLTARRAPVADAAAVPLTDIAPASRSPETATGSPAQSYRNLNSASSPSIVEFTRSTSPSLMPTEAESPIVMKGADFGVIDPGDMARRTSQSAVPMTRFTSVAQRRRADLAVPSDVPVPAVKLTNLASTQPRSIAPTSLLARNASPPDPRTGQVYDGGTISNDVQSQYFVNRTSELGAFDDRSLSRASDTHNPFSEVPARSDLPMPVVSRRHAVAGIHGPERMPLLVYRAPSPGSAPGNQPIPDLMRDPETLAVAGPVSGTPNHTPPQGPEADVEDIVERAWHALMSRLAIEQERRGFGRWA